MCFSSGWRRLALATAILTRSSAFFVAASFSCMWTQLHWSRMFAISKRYSLSPASLRVALNSGSWVRGVHEATTTRLSLCSMMVFLILSCVSWLQV